MTDKNGIYLSVDGDNAVRVIIENNSKIQTDKIKISDELMRENDLAAGVLLRATIYKLLDIEDDGSAICLMTAMNDIADALQEPLDTQYILYKYLKSRSEFDTHDK